MKLINIDTSSDKLLIKEYISMYLKLMDLHYEAAALQGIYDKKCDNKTKTDAIEKLKDPNIRIELLCDNAEVVGYVRYQYDDTETQFMITEDNYIGIHIRQLYIKNAWRSNEYGTYIIQELKNRHKKISLNCYYSLEANDFYKKLGFKPVITTYLS
ncbi:GNAT family N-acetyltransferase [Hungatella hathewayi]|uniref:GNAT family N-acetyltransferase n=1 Tax=Hungatella hathewayi TaxID=154046 RepID=UPI003562C281